MTSQTVLTPIAAGVLHPAVILPERLLETLTPIQLRHILAHELTHIRLRHGVSGFAQRLAGLLFWAHPLVRALCAALSAAREEICDNVASQDDGAACYARTLLAVAEQIRCAPINLASGLLFLGPGTSLEDRIAGLLDPRRIKQVQLSPSKIWAVTGALVVTILGAAAFRVKSVDRQDQPNPVMTASRSDQSVDIVTQSSMPDAYDLSAPAPHVNINPPRENPLIKRLVGIGQDTIEVRAGRGDIGSDGQSGTLGEPAATQLAQVVADDSDSPQTEQAYLALAERERANSNVSTAADLLASIATENATGLRVIGGDVTLENLSVSPTNDIQIQLKEALDDIQSSRYIGDSTISVDGGIDTGTGPGGEGGDEFLYNTNDAGTAAPVNVRVPAAGETMAQVLSTLGMQTGERAAVIYTLQSVGAVQNGAAQSAARWMMSKP
jgi:hypothetical protein